GQHGREHEALGLSVAGGASGAGDGIYARPDRAGVEVEPTLVTMLIHVFADQLEARRQLVVATESDFVFVTLGDTDEAGIALGVDDADFGAQHDRTVGVGYAGEDCFLLRPA